MHRLALGVLASVFCLPTVVAAQAPAPLDLSTRQTVAEKDGPETLSYREGDAIPTGYHLETRQHTGLLAAGLSVFFGMYLPTMTVGLLMAADDEGWAGSLAIPIAGPLIAIATQPSASCSDAFFDDLCRTGQTLELAFFVVSFIGQLTGGIMTAYGLTSADVLVRHDIAAVRFVPSSAGADLGGGSLRVAL